MVQVGVAAVVVGALDIRAQQMRLQLASSVVATTALMGEAKWDTSTMAVELLTNQRWCHLGNHRGWRHYLV